MTRHIYVFEPITEITANRILQQLIAFDKESKEKITMFINSPGGYVTSLFSVIDAMNTIASPVETVVVGEASSAAAVIAINGKTRYMTENSHIMIHEVLGGSIGRFSDNKDHLEYMEKQQNKIVDIIARKASKTSEEIETIIERKDKYFSPQEAVNYGLADQILRRADISTYKLSETLNADPIEEIDLNNLKEVHLLKIGKFQNTQYGDIEITQEVLKTMKNNFDNNVRGQEISIDYTHDNNDGEKRAAFWIKNLVVKNDGLYAQGEYTPEAEKLVKEKAYKYVSAEFVVNYASHNGDNIPFVLLGGTLTNRPVLKGLNTLKLSEKTKGENIMDKNALIAELKNHGVDVLSLQSESSKYQKLINEKDEAIDEKEKELADKEKELSKAQEAKEELESELENQKKEKLFSELVNAGKVLVSQKEKLFNLFDKAEKMDEFFKDAPAIVNLKAKGSDAGGEDLTDAERAVLKNSNISKEDFEKYYKSKKEA